MVGRAVGTRSRGRYTSGGFGELAQLTTDHTLGAPGTTHALTRAVGAQDDLRVDHFKETVHLHDRYLICSDGVHGALSRKEIHALLARRASPKRGNSPCT